MKPAKSGNRAEEQPLEVAPVETPPPFRFEDWPFHWITRTNGRYFQMMEKALKPLELDIAQWRVLMFLDDVWARSISEIAETCLIKLSTTTKIVQRLQVDDLVHCRPGRRDARVTEVRLTPAGKALQARVRAEIDAVFARVFDGIDPARVAAANAVLAEVCDRLDTM